MPSLSSLARRLSDRAFGTPFDRALERARRAGHRGFLFFWNRGLGDIPIGLAPLFEHIRRAVPQARIAVVTREELRLAFTMAGVDEVHVLPGLARERRVPLARACATLGLDARRYETRFDFPDPRRWQAKLRGTITPRLRWDPDWDALGDALVPPRPDVTTVAAHVQSETTRYYGYRKDWPIEAWRALVARYPAARGVRWLLLGYSGDPPVEGANVADLRGRTDFPALLAVIRRHARVLVAPDSGILSVAFYLDVPFPIEIVSLWSDPRQGVLWQGRDSPNPMLVHTPIVAPGEELAKLGVDEVAAALDAALARARAATPR